MARVLITTVPFAVHNRLPLDLLEGVGVDYVINPIGRRLTEDELAGLVGDTEILIAGTEPITAKVMDAAPHLNLLSRVGIGLDALSTAIDIQGIAGHQFLLLVYNGLPVSGTGRLRARAHTAGR